MRFLHTCIETVVHNLPDDIVTSDEIESRLAPVYKRLHLPAGRLELMTGIRERRFYPPGTLPGDISAVTAKQAVEQSGIDPRLFGALIHGSVCRDQMEPATANRVHHAAGLPNEALVFDVSNACLGLLNGVMLLANMIERGQIRAGVVVGTEIGRNLVEGTIDTLLGDDKLNRKSIKGEFASLTIGSGSAAIVVCHDEISREKHRLLGGEYRANTATFELCSGGVNADSHGDDRPRMQTDSESLLHAGVDLAVETWQAFRSELDWSNDEVNHVFTHQVGRQHRKLLMERLGLDPQIDFPTVEFLGNTGAVALPIAFSLGIEQNRLSAGDRIALLGIGSGLNALMLGVEW